MLSAKSAPLAATPSGRLSYARIAEVRDGISVDKFEVPNLIELQLESFQWFIEKGLRDLFDDFSACFNDADTVMVAPVYAAGEEPIDGVSSEALVSRIRSAGPASWSWRRRGPRRLAWRIAA